MDYPYSAVLILPSEYKDDGDALSETMGWGPNCYSVPLSETGHPPATHYGCRAQVQQSFIDMVENPEPENVPLVTALVYDFNDTLAPYDHWTNVLESNGLMVCQT